MIVINRPIRMPRAGPTLQRDVRYPRSISFLHKREHVAVQVLQVCKGSAPVLFFRAPGEFDALGDYAIVLFRDVIDHEGDAHKSTDQSRSLTRLVRRTLFNRKAYAFACFELGPTSFVGVVDLHAERLSVEVEGLVKIRYKHSDEADFHGSLLACCRMRASASDFAYRSNSKRRARVMVCCSLLGLDPDSRRSNIAFSVCAALNVSHLATPIRGETTTMAVAQIP